MDNSWTVYMHVFPNGKKYIGITARKVVKRWQQGNGYREHPVMWRAIQKYGWDNIEHLIIAEQLNQEEALKMEAELIKQYKTFPPSLGFGYNATSGGEARIPSDEVRARQSVYSKAMWQNPEMRKKLLNRRPPQWSEEQRRQISERQKGEKNPMYGKHLPEETRRKISESEKGRKAWNTGKKLSAEHCAKLSAIRKGRKLSATTVEKIRQNSMKKVLCVETGIVYDSQRIAAQTLGLNEAHISECIKGSGRRNICGGFHWQRYNDFPEVTEVSMDEFLNNQGGNT